MVINFYIRFVICILHTCMIGLFHVFYYCYCKISVVLFRFHIVDYIILCMSFSECRHWPV